ncbi:hypothetical protein CYMTET_34302 [Cymbomonas tetramitiformis]|uniref:Uncharacterized protein n=1 Tax=Cymbomonas tetramitiformis TaxID=36881 RepID=A0AAE0KQC2_9CHLO|nr:hypothetical protein CYMTET_34302 [Cymbomonas tetramitiformis]
MALSSARGLVIICRGMGCWHLVVNGGDHWRDVGDGMWLSLWCMVSRHGLMLLSSNAYGGACQLDLTHRTLWQLQVLPKVADTISEASTDEAMKGMSETMRNAVIQRYVSMIKHAKETHAWNDREQILTTRLNHLEEDVAQAEREIDTSRRQTEELQQKVRTRTPLRRWLNCMR